MPLLERLGERPKAADRSAPSVDSGVSRMTTGTEHIETVIIGGGQAGLAVGYYLAQRGRPFVVLDANERIGDAWRHRWDSLRLFTARRFCGLPGLAVPGPAWSAPTKDEMADYLEAYAGHFAIPVRSRARVDSLDKRDGRYVLDAGDQQIEADHVVIATGAQRVPRVPEFAAELDPQIVQLHSVEYRNPSQLRAGNVLLVGAGNSGADIALEVAREHPTWLAGRHPGHVPVDIDGIGGRLTFPVVRFLFHNVLTERTPMGRKARAKVMTQGDPLVRVKPKQIQAAGVQRVPRVAGVRDGMPLLEDGSLLDVANVVWCTGFHYDFSWIRLPVVAANGMPLHDRGVAHDEPDLCFIGLIFQFSMSSEFLPGIGRDHEYVASHIADRAAQALNPVADERTRAA